MSYKTVWIDRFLKKKIRSTEFRITFFKTESNYKIKF